MKIYKTVINVIILSEDRPFGNGEWDLKDAQYFIEEGDGIGTYEIESIDEVPDGKVEDELLAIGNDGTFFGPYGDDDE